MSLADYIGRYWAGAEILYGAIIAMTFTSSLREYPGVPDLLVRNIVLAALFCCVAWGLADGFFYLWEREYLVRQENRAIALARAGGDAAALLADQLDDSILRNVSAEERAGLYAAIARHLAASPGRGAVAPREAATLVLGTFVRSALAGLVIVAPFFLVDDAMQALWASNALGILLLFAVGYTRALDQGVVPRLVNGLGAAMVGVVIAAITIALGG